MHSLTLATTPFCRASQSWFERALTSPAVYEQFPTYRGRAEATAAAAVPPPEAAVERPGEPMLRDIVTGEVVRDYRLEPVKQIPDGVKQIARWLGSPRDEGSPALRRERDVHAGPQ